jgi:Trk K+ transport system NAD-binding subunit
MNRPVIVCGLGRVGRRVLEYLRAAQLPAVVIDTKLDPATLLPGVRGVSGDCRQPGVLQEAGIADAGGVLVCTSDDLVNVTTALAARRLNPDVRIVVRLFNQNLLPRLGKAVHNTFALSVSALSAPLIALTALTGDVLGAFSLPDGPRQVATVTVEKDSPLVGKVIADVSNRMLTLALQPATGPDRFLLDVPPDAILAPGDRLVVCGPPREIARLLGRDDENSILSVHWAGWLRRHGRAVWRTVREIDTAVLICSLILLIVVTASTLTFRYAAGEKWGAALRTTVGVIATAGALPAAVDSPGMEVFVSFLRISGAALTAAFTAIVTQYLLRARLGGAFDLRRIPDSGHVVVCGLGNIGFRVVEELLKADEQVVVIEADRNNRFLASARRLGAAIVPGDATVPEVLRQARAGAARAVIAATGQELANVEVALLTRELNPTQRVVVRLSDADLAETLREAANVRLALSVPALAAPAFVAALFGDRVQCPIRIGTRVLMVVEVTVPEGDVCLDGQSVRAVAVDFQILPVAVVGPEGQMRARTMEARLAAGDRLTAVAALPDLERLFRRERLPAEWSVEVSGFPLPARPHLVLLARAKLGLTAEAADERLNCLPFVMECGLTRGQAGDLLWQLGRERIACRLVREQSATGGVPALER